MAFNSTNVSNYGAIGGESEVMFAGRNSAQINTICESVTTNIYTINSCVRNLKLVYRTIGTERDNQSTRDQIHVWQLSTNQVVEVTKSHFEKLSRLARTADKPHQLQIEKLSNHFQEAVTQYSQFLNEIVAKLRVTLVRSPSEDLTENEGAGLLSENEKQMRIQQHAALEFEQGMLEDRQRQVLKIEGDIINANQLMKELSALTHEQGAVVDTIENNVETVHNDVEAAGAELRQAARYQNRARKKTLILLLIAGLAVGVIVVMIYLSFR